MSQLIRIALDLERRSKSVKDAAGCMLDPQST